MKEILLKIITLLHVLFVLFVILAPLFDSNYFLFLHSIFIPFIMLHWICNDNTCALTLIERKLRKDILKQTDDEDCITCRLIEPVYDFKNNYKRFSNIIYAITIGLWIIATSKLICKYKFGLIKGWRDIFII